MKKLFFLDRDLINRWTKRIAIISAVLFIISLVGMLAGSTLIWNEELAMT
jgi:hypothetical protein